MAPIKNKQLTAIMQGARLKSLFPSSNFKLLNHGLGMKWEGFIQPNPISPPYHISITYLQGKHPITKVHSSLIIPEGKKLPHVYSQSKKELCLYYPKDNEWHKGLWIVETILPWASEWLYHYENWVVTGHWKGGGIDHDIPSNPEELTPTIDRKVKFSTTISRLLK